MNVLDKVLLNCSALFRKKLKQKEQKIEVLN